jgi:hypothetical protein
MAAAADELKRVELFSGLSRRQLQKLASTFHERHFAAEAPIVREGAMSGIGFFVIAEGDATVSVKGKQVAAPSGSSSSTSPRSFRASSTSATPRPCCP